MKQQGYTSSILPILFLLLLVGCKEKPAFTTIDPISFPYKFKSEIQQQLKENSEPWKYQLAAWDYSNIGEYTQTLITWDQDNRPLQEFDSLAFLHFTRSYQAQNALDYISKIADTSKIVIINEAHHQALHRVFTTALLIELYDKGFRYLGLETLDHSDPEINQRKYPIYSSGTYSMEPQFGNLIRKALEIGYTLFPYESDGNGRDREIGQARNIQEQLNKDPSGKFLIHCGFAHAAEGEYKTWGKAMAGRVHEFTGIDPVTINQTEFTERSSAELSHPLLQQLDITAASVFVDTLGHSFKHPTQATWFDIMLFHPKTKMEAGRPKWLFQNNKQKVVLDLTQIKIDFPVLVLAFKEKEDLKQAIPFDIVHLENSIDEVVLALEKGKYTIIIQNQEEDTRLTSISVK
ncbi:MAG: hypothetical protein AAFP19_22210 [Bacteroidota bacterium]